MAFCTSFLLQCLKHAQKHPPYLSALELFCDNQEIIIDLTTQEYHEHPPCITQHQKSNQTEIQALSVAGLLEAYTPIFHGSLEFIIDPFHIKSKYNLFPLFP